MQIVTNQTPETSAAQFPTLEQIATAGISTTPDASDGHDWDDSNFPPLELVTRPSLTTAEAAHYLNRKPQTLRSWASTEAGPIRPVRINGRLSWLTAGIRKLLAGGA